MGKENYNTFGDIEIEKHKLKVLFLEDVDTDNVLA